MRRRSEQLTCPLGPWAWLVAATLLAPAVPGCGEGGMPLGPPDMATGVDVGVLDADTPPTDLGRRDMGMTDLGTTDGGGTDSGADDQGAAQDLGGGGGCPDIAGTYAVGATGIGCGTLGASQVIEQGSVGACTLAFTSAATLSGSATIAADGSFVGQTLSLGGTSRSCRGTWNAVLGQYSVVCGAGPTLCNVTLN